MNAHVIFQRLGFSLCRVLSSKQIHSVFAVVLLGLCAGAGHAQTMTVLSGPPTTLSSGANPGVITVGEENPGTGTFSFATGVTGISLTISASGSVSTTTAYPGATYTTTTGLAVIALTNPGSGYTSAPAVTISAPTGASPVTATATADYFNGVVTGITITNAGSGYIAPPTVTIGAPASGTNNATATAVLSLYNGIATFDLSQAPLFALGSGTAPNAPQTTSYTFTYTDTTNTSIRTTSSISVTVPTALYIVDSFNSDSSSYTCTAQPVQNSGNNYTVLPTLDSGVAATNFCNLRTALTKVNTLTSSNSATIAFNATQTTGSGGLDPTTGGTAAAWPQVITLASSLATVTWTAALTMTGPGPSNLFISGANTGTNGFAMFAEASGTNALNLSGMTLENAYGTGTGGTSGEALFLYSTGATNISNVNFLNNTTTYQYGGPAIYIKGANSGTVTVSNCLFGGNSVSSSATAPGNGGAISSLSTTGSLTVNNSTFVGNSTSYSTGNGGAIAWVPIAANTTVTTQAITITNSLFASNSATVDGGALGLVEYTSTTDPASVVLTNDTFYLNSVAGANGGAVYLNSGCSTSCTHYLAASLTDVTIVGNESTNASASGGGVYSGQGANTTVNNSIIAGNALPNSSTGTSDIGCYNTCTFNGGNVYSTTGTHTSPYAYPGIAALKLSDLGSYGGPTQTLVPLPGSVALKNSPYIVSGTNPATDQRGFSRPTTGTNTIDTGAVQTNPSVKFVTQPGNETTGDIFSPVPTAQYLDSGYVITDTVASISFTAALTNGTLSGTTTVPSTGTAAFSSISSSTPETATQLTATVGAGTTPNPHVSATSSSIEILGPTAQVVYGTAPTATISAGSSSGNVVVDIEDSAGNIETASSATVYLEITGPAGYTTYTTSIAATSGVATFSGLPALTINGSYSYIASLASNYGSPNVTAAETVNVNTTALMLAVTPSTTEPYGTEVTLTATLSPYSQGTASTNGEAITFKSNGTILGTATLANGMAKFTTGGLNVGTDSLTASYAGDPAFSAVSSSGINEASTPPPFTPIKAGTPVTVTLTFTNNFTMGSTSPSIATSGTANSPFAITGGTCAANTAYGPSSAGGTSCTVTVTYTPSSSTGGGFITGTVQAFDTNAVLQGASNVTASRYR